MLNLNLIRGTKVYQEAFEEGREEGREEGKLELVPKLLEQGLSVQEVAKILELDSETVRQAARQ